MLASRLTGLAGLTRREGAVHRVPWLRVGGSDAVSAPPVQAGPKLVDNVESSAYGCRPEIPRSISETAPLFPRSSLVTRLAGALMLGAVLSLIDVSAIQAAQHSLPLLRPAGHGQEGYARVINHSNRGGTVRITGIDDGGKRYGPVTLRLGAHVTRYFNARDLERGNAARGLSGRLGDGRGNWRLELSTGLDIAPSAYVRRGGFLTEMNALVGTRRDAGGGVVHHVPVFNPASDISQRSWLRVINRASRRVTVTVRGRDDAGRWAPRGAVRFSLGAGASRMVSAQQLESGVGDVTGRLGDGAGRWRLMVSSGGAIEVMSLMQSPAGHLSNVSASAVRQAGGGRQHSLPLLRPAGHGQEGYVRVINHSIRGGTVRITGIDDGGRRYGPVTLRLGAHVTRYFNARDLERGNAARGLSGRLGNGRGNWRLELSTGLDIEPSAYVRRGGFLTEMNALVGTRRDAGGGVVHHVPVFNPASDISQRSWLRVINRASRRVTVTMRGRDDAGRAGPRGAVRFGLGPGASRLVSAQQLESGAGGLTGRLGDGTGRWRLMVSSGGAIEVMSLMQSPNGHLSNVSATARGADGTAGLRIVVEGAATVRPLQTIVLAVPGGLGDSNYTVLMDLSGTGGFAAGDTIEVEGLTTDQDRILTASPMRQALAERNAEGRLALRVRREADGALSNVLRLSIEEVTIPPHLSGYPTMLLETMLKAIYTEVGDPLLEAEAASLQPGLAFKSARTLGLDVSVIDAQADAVLEALFGVSVTTLLAEAGLTPQASAAAETGLEGVFHAKQLTAQGAEQLRRACEVVTVAKGTSPGICPGIARAVQCDLFEDLYATSWDSTCAYRSFEGRFQKDFLAAVVPTPMGKVKAKTWSKVQRWVLNRLPRGSRKAAITALSYKNSVNAQVGGSLKLSRVRDDPREARPGDRHYTEDATGRRTATKRGTRIPFDTLVALIKATTRDAPEQMSDVQRDYGDRSLGEEEKTAVWGIVEDSDRHRREAETIEDHEGVYTGEQDPRDAIGNDPDGGQAVGSSCKTGYREFVIEEDKISTCVFESLVEPRCYAGSRRVQEPDLGRSNACLYYSLDFYQPNGKCRQNYADVPFQGRRTCRWAKLGRNQAAWYTLYKAPDDGMGPEDGEVPPEVASCIARLGYDDLESVYGISGISTYGLCIHCFFLGYDAGKCRCCDIVDSYIEENPVRTVSIDGFLFVCAPVPGDPFLALQGYVPGTFLRVAPAAGRDECRMTVNARRAECRQVLNSDLVPQIEDFSPLFDSCRATFNTQVRNCEAHFDRERAKCGG